ncbi:F0F1 ATP synthase subunit A [Lacihabitans soyangensis]|uniref:ATP synthase subunit a n=1 Tax=Lacihabitans soyangensis TaxID=869394 RepID=A0AAE3KWC0_9BACT|nr:F0F1 ATP synthase subunit A [Lacihabitans soyangensis]MCP9762625.1 ATP synthase F0 subunit A [Lacihabitans soyangensis]
MFKYVYSLVFCIILGISPSFSQHTEEHAAATTAGHEEEKFDIGGMIMHHIADEHGWEFTHGVKLPLPIILYTADRGIEVFSSSRLDHGQVYNDYKNEHEHIVRVNADGTVNEAIHPMDFSITKNVATLMLGALLLILIFTSVSKGYVQNKGKAPKGIQSFLEPLIVYMRDEVVKPSIGKNYGKYFPYLLTLFFFIFINNLLGLLPGGANLTGNIAITLVLALITFLITNLSANKYYWKHILLPNTPKWMWVIMIPVEVVGVLMKPLSLMIRLFANITAGHIIMLSLFGLIFIFKSWAVAPAIGVFALFMSAIELLVAFLQAFIFTLLTSMYIGSAIEEHHAEEHH